MIESSGASQIYKPNAQGQINFDGDSKIDAVLENGSLELGEETYEASDVDGLMWIDNGDGIYNAEKDQVLIIKDNKVYNPEGEELGQLDTADGTINFKFEGKTYYGLCDKNGNWNVSSSSQPETKESKLTKTEDNNYTMTIAGAEYAVAKGKDNKGNSCFVISDSSGEAVGFMEICDDEEPGLGSITIDGETYDITNIDGEIKYTKDELSDNSELIESSNTEESSSITDAEVEELANMTDTDFDNWVSSFKSNEELTEYIHELSDYYKNSTDAETKDSIGEIFGKTVALKSEDATLDDWVHSLDSDEFLEFSSMCINEKNWPNPDQDNASIGWGLLISSLCVSGNEKQTQEVLQTLLDTPSGEHITTNIFALANTNGNLEQVLSFDKLGLTDDEITETQGKVLEDLQDVMTCYGYEFSDDAIANVVASSGANTTEVTVAFSATVNFIIGTAGAVVGALDNLSSSAFDNATNDIATDSSETQSYYPSKIDTNNYQSYGSLNESTVNSLLTYLYDDLTNYDDIEEKVVFATMLEDDLAQVCDDINNYTGEYTFSELETSAEANANTTTIDAIELYKNSDEYPGDSDATIDSFEIWIRSQGPGLEPNKSYGTDAKPIADPDPIEEPEPIVEPEPEEEISFNKSNVTEAINHYLFGPDNLMAKSSDNYSKFESWANKNQNSIWSEDVKEAISIYNESDSYSSDSTVKDFKTWLKSI